MARFYWTDDALASLRRDMNLGLSYAEIAAKLGCTENAVRCRSYKAGFSSRGRSGMLTAQRCKGKSRPASLRRILSAKARERWQDPEYRARAVPAIAEASRDPERRRKLSEARYRKLGIARPPEDHDYWAFLAAGYSAAEAAVASKLIPQSTTASKGA